MTIDRQLEYLSEVVDSQPEPITKKEMEQMLVDIDKKEQMNTYRSVEEAPVVVDIVDISDAAAKTLANKLTPETDEKTQIIQPDKKESNTSMIDKILDFAKGSFSNIIKMIGKVVGWLTGTVTNIFKQVAGWVLGRIQKAMAVAVARSSANMGGRFGKLLGLAIKGGAMVAGGLAAYNAYEGLSDFKSKLDTVPAAASQIFNDPESIITTGDVSTPEKFSGGASSNTVIESPPNETTVTSSTSNNQEPSELPNTTTELSNSPLILPDESQPLPVVSDTTDTVNLSQANTTNNINEYTQAPTSISEDNSQINQLTNVSVDDDSKQIDQFISASNMFDKSSDTMINDMTTILNESQRTLPDVVNKSTSTSNQQSVNVSNDPVKTISTNVSNPSTSSLNISPSTDSTNIIQTAEMKQPGDSTNITDVTDNTSNNLYNQLSSETSDIVSKLDQKINASIPKGGDTNVNLSSNITTSSGANLTTKPSSTLSELQQSNELRPTSEIDRSAPQVKNIQELNTNTTNLKELQVNFSTKLGELQDVISKKEPPKIVNIDQSQTINDTDYISSIDNIRNTTRSVY